MTTPLPVLDLTDPAFWADPHPVLATALAVAPVATGPGGQGLMVLGYPEVQGVLRDPALGTVDLLARVGIVDGPLADWWGRVMFSADPPVHTRLRKLVSRAFTPRRVAELEPAVTVIVGRVLDDLAAGPDEADLVASFAHLVPLRVMQHVLGIPAEDEAVFAGWTAELGLVFAPVMTPELRSRLEATVVALDGYVSDLVEERRATPADDLLGALVAAEDDGDRLSREELVAMVSNLLFAGHDTTRSLLSIGPAVLLQHPEQLALLRAEPERWPAAVEELLRFEPPVLGTARRTLAPTEVGGIPVPAGVELSTNLLAANRDPRVFVEPHRFDVTRDGPPVVSFGAGIHHCLGAALARLEARVALPMLFDRFPGLVLVDRPAWVPYASIRRFGALPVRLH
jgi:cytochrome P450